MIRQYHIMMTAKMKPGPWPRGKRRPKTRGGFRPGAGRKPVMGVARTSTMSFKVTPDERVALLDRIGDDSWSDWARETLMSTRPQRKRRSFRARKGVST